MQYLKIKFNQIVQNFFDGNKKFNENLESICDKIQMIKNKKCHLKELTKCLIKRVCFKASEPFISHANPKDQSDVVSKIKVLYSNNPFLTWMMKLKIAIITILMIIPHPQILYSFFLRKNFFASMPL